MFITKISEDSTYIEQPILVTAGMSRLAPKKLKIYMRKDNQAER